MTGASQAPRVGPVTAVVCNYEGEAYLPRCLDALLALEEGPDEILVVDNASTDGSRALVAERYPDVRVLALEENGGPTVARNAGMRAATHDWVLLVDNDAAPEPDVLRKLVAVAEARPDAALLQPRSVFEHEQTRVHYDGGAAHYAGLIALRNFYTPIAEAAGGAVEDVDIAVSVCLLADRRELLEAGGFDEGYFILFEDLDLSYRLRLAGRAIVSVEDALCRHASGTEGISFRKGPMYPERRVFLHSRNRWWYLLKCYSWRTLFVALPGLCVYEAVWFVFALKQRAPGAWFRGKGTLWTDRKQLMAARRSVQSARTQRDRELLVGGPLTLTPSLVEGRLMRTVARALDGMLRGWWWLVRPLAG